MARHSAPLPPHFLPNYSDAERDDSLFHYTSAAGVTGILTSGQIWSTAYYCTNDETELSTGQGILRPLFYREAARLRQIQDPRVDIFASRGVDIDHYADIFEQQLVGTALSRLCTYVTCFFRPTCKEDFHHGLLSQWRGYGADGGFALQFRKSKLIEQTKRLANSGNFEYDLQDVHYTSDNALKDEVLGHKDAYLAAFSRFLDEIADWDYEKQTHPSPISGLAGGPIEAYLGYLAHTKNSHFSEERESRLSLTQFVPTGDGCQPTNFLCRGGLIVPYVKSPVDYFDVLDCLEWIVVGPGPRLDSRFKAAQHLIRESGRKVEVRASHIPYTRQ